VCVCVCVCCGSHHVCSWVVLDAGGSEAVGTDNSTTCLLEQYVQHRFFVIWPLPSPTSQVDPLTIPISPFLWCPLICARAHVDVGERAKCALPLIESVHILGEGGLATDWLCFGAQWPANVNT